MGKTTEYKYRVEQGSDLRGWQTFAGWSHGRATVANLEKYRKALNASFLPGGVNDARKAGLSVTPYYSGLRLVNQRTGAVVAKTNAPMFEVVG